MSAIIVKTKVEYALADDGGVIQMHLNDDRERAFKLVEYFNRKYTAGDPGAEHFTVLTRTVTYSAWTQANTGIVPPFVTDPESRRGGVTG